MRTDLLRRAAVIAALAAASCGGAERVRPATSVSTAPVAAGRAEEAVATVEAQPAPSVPAASAAPQSSGDAGATRAAESLLQGLERELDAIDTDLRQATDGLATNEGKDI